MPSRKPAPVTARRRGRREAAPSSGLPRAIPLPDQVVSALRQRITGGELGAGEQLPTEKELGELYGVSRAVVREAVGRLKHDGLVTSRQGLGAFVAEPGAASAFRLEIHLDDAEEMRNLIEFLVAVEVAVAENAAERRSAQQLVAIRRALEAMRRRSAPAATPSTRTCASTGASPTPPGTRSSWS